MSADCREKYRLSLVSDLLNLTRTINYRICTRAMCSYATGTPGGGIRVNEADPRSSQVVFFAINTAALTNPVAFNFVASTVSHDKTRYYNNSHDIQGGPQ